MPLIRRATSIWSQFQHRRAPSAIYECAASCQTGGTGTLLYSDANSVSQIAFDPWGNLFFTEGVYTSGTNFGNLESASSNLQELPYTAGTGFAATPTLLQTLTDASPGSYDNQLDGVAVTSNGTVYYATQNEGTFGIPNTKTGGPDTAHQFVVSSLGAKGMELDANGNEWVVVYHSGGDNLGEALINDLTTPNAQYDGAPVTTSATVVDNAFGCGTAATLAIASSNAEFSATAGAYVLDDFGQFLHAGLRFQLSGHHHLPGNKAQYSNRNVDCHRYHQRRRRNRNGDRLRVDDSADAHLYGAHNNYLHLHP